MVCPAIRTIPPRGGPLFSATTSVTAPDAVPFFPVDTSIHGVCDAAVQLQPVSVSTAMVTFPPAADTVVLGGATVNRHGAAS